MTRLTVHSRSVVGSEGDEQVERLVECPAGRRSVDVKACAHCGYSRAGTRDDVVECERESRSSDEPASFSSQIRVVPVTSAARHHVVAASTDAPADALRRKMTDGRLGCIVVVDPLGAAIGMITAEDLLLRGDSSSVASDVMSAPVITVGESAAITRAAAIMAYEGIHHLPVVNSAGVVVALLSSLDVLRYLAREQGFLLS